MRADVAARVPAPGTGGRGSRRPAPPDRSRESLGARECLEARP